MEEEVFDIRPGEPSGHRIAGLLRDRAREIGVDAVVDVVPLEMAGAYLVNIGWGPQPDSGFLLEVADWVKGVRILDSGDEDVTVEQGLNYFAARASGSTAHEALRVAVPRPAWRWGRHLERRRRRRVPFYGSCPRCNHDWREHPGGIFGNANTCGECEYEVEHDERDTQDPPCSLYSPAPPRREA